MRQLDCQGQFGWVVACLLILREFCQRRLLKVRKRRGAPFSGKGTHKLASKASAPKL